MNLWHKILGIKDHELQAKDFTLTDAGISRLFGRFGDNPPRRGTAELIESYNELPRFRSVLNRVATSVACNKWHPYITKKGTFARRGLIDELQHLKREDPVARKKLIRDLSDAGDLEPLDRPHPMLEAIQRPTPEHTPRQRQILSQIWMDVAGEAFWIIERGEKGLPFEFWPIPPSWVSKTPSSMQAAARDPFQVDYYEVLGRNNVRVPKKDMLWFRDPNPSNPYGRGTGFGHALNDELDVEEYATKTTAARFYNQAVPNMLIGVEGADEDELRRFAKQFDDKHRGWQRAYRPHFVGSGNVKVHPLDVSFVDLQMVEQRKYETQVICQTLGIPPEILGIIENSNRSTIDAADFIYSLYLLVPRLDFWEDQYNMRVGPMYDGEIVLLYESPVPEDWEFVVQHMAAHPYAFDLDEIRDMIDYEPLEGGVGKLHPIKAGWSMQTVKEGVGMESLTDKSDEKEEKPKKKPNRNEEGERKVISLGG